MPPETPSSDAEPLAPGCATRPSDRTSHVDIVLTFVRVASGHVSEMTENLIRGEALPLGIVDVKVAAIDTDWSGLKPVWRKELRVGR